MASQRLIPFMIAGGVGECTSLTRVTLQEIATVLSARTTQRRELIQGVAGGLYIWQQPMQELSGKTPSSGEVKDGRSQSIKDGNGDHSPLKNGGSNTNDLSKPNIAGSSSSARMNNTGELLEVTGTRTMVPVCRPGQESSGKDSEFG